MNTLSLLYQNIYIIKYTSLKYVHWIFSYILFQCVCVRNLGIKQGCSCEYIFIILSQHCPMIPVISQCWSKLYVRIYKHQQFYFNIFMCSFVFIIISSVASPSSIHLIIVHHAFISLDILIVLIINKCAW